jgi:hypothetical protein
MSNEIVVQQQTNGFMQINTLKEALECAKMLSKTSLCPKQFYDRPEDIVIAFQMGQELGLKPMQAIQNISVINGRPSLWGDAMLAVCRQSPSFEFIKEEYLESTNTYVCRLKRKNEPEFIQSFSEKDAILAGLWKKQGPWTQYPKRMLQMRARGFCLRDAFPDLLRGILTTEEAMDIPKEKRDYSRVGVTIEHKADANECSTKISADELEILKDKIQRAQANQDKICKLLGIKKIEDMLVSDFSQICSKLDKQADKIVQKEPEVEIPLASEEEEKIAQEWLNS